LEKSEDFGEIRRQLQRDLTERHASQKVRRRFSEKDVKNDSETKKILI